MSVSRHPIALRLEQRVGGPTRLLATVMALPLIDGIFPALVLAGALTSPFGIVEAGLLIFGGSATVAVILAEMNGTPREQARTILLLGTIIIPVAVIEAAIAPTIASVLVMDIFQRFAGLVILTVAAHTASAKVGEYLPRPGVIIALGLVASLQPSQAALTVSYDLGLIARSAATAGVGVGFALLVALGATRLRGAVDLDLFRFGSAVALGMLALSVLEVMPTDAPIALGVLLVTVVFAYDPDAEGYDLADGSTPSPGPSPDDHAKAEASEAGTEAIDEASVAEDTDAYGYPGDEDSRAPWL